MSETALRPQRRPAVALAERGLLPDRVIRAGIRSLLDQRLKSLPHRGGPHAPEYLERFTSTLAASSIATLTDKANEQHYELPAAFFRLVLGPHLKYSSAFWAHAPAHPPSLARAEAEALRLTCEHARLGDAQRILELGCGWGSLTLWMAENYPRSRITAVSNSHSQRAYILGEAARRGFSNVTVLTADMNDFRPDGRFDRVVSVEMFEHLRNWPEVFRRVEDWLVPGGYFFLHVFAHRSTPYLFEVADASDWMSAHFFSGGMMPSDELAVRVAGRLAVRERWRWSGVHYRDTAEAWLGNLDAHRAEVLQIFKDVYGAQARQWLQRWRIFFMACAELFGHDDGREWGVSHYLLERTSSG
ncbi:MAG TPA: cyclopropane-fatty-acyl-phospholipid synthase family protein [Steroidobacteraceae bacterium]|nr:cyclopropane-fatty-acyl-phospholipid synthase family protein [Steroidobacteraceae bacterium]